MMHSVKGVSKKVRQSLTNEQQFLSEGKEDVKRTSSTASCVQIKTEPNFKIKTEKMPKKKKCNKFIKGQSLKKVVVKKLIKKAEEHRNRLYVRLKKGFESTPHASAEQQAMAMHPDILSVSLPRRGEKMRFFYGEFKSEEVALAAMKDLRKRGDCYVGPPISLEIISKKANKIIKKKIPKRTKAELRDDWN